MIATRTFMRNCSRRNADEERRQGNLMPLSVRKICYLIATLEIGGAEKQLLKLTRGLDRTRFFPVVIVLRSGGALKKEFAESGIKVRQVGKKFKLDITFFLRLVKFLKKEKPDIVHTFMFTANTWGRLAAKAAGIRMIFSSERCVDLWKRWYHKVIDKVLLKFTCCTVANSFAVRDFYIKLENIPPEKITVIPNGIDVQDFDRYALSGEKKKALNLENCSFLIGAGGRFTSQKGFVYLIQAMPEVLKVFPEAKLIMVGDGPLRVKLELRARQLGVRESVIFTGYRKDIHEILAATRMVIVPSLFEGMPNIVLEAMALKKAVVGSNIPEIAELIKEGITGLLVPVADFRALAEKIIFLLGNPVLCENIGKRGYEFVKENFSVAKMVQRYQQLYESFLKGTD